MKFVDFKVDDYVSNEVKDIIEMMKNILKDAHNKKKFMPLKEIMTEYEKVLSNITVSKVNATHKYLRSKDIERPEVAHALLDRVFGGAVIFYDIGAKEEKKDGA